MIWRISIRANTCYSHVASNALERDSNFTKYTTKMLTYNCFLMEQQSSGINSKILQHFKVVFLANMYVSRRFFFKVSNLDLSTYKFAYFPLHFIIENDNKKMILSKLLNNPWNLILVDCSQ